MQKQPTPAAQTADPKHSALTAPFWALWASLLALMALEAPAEQYWQLMLVSVVFLASRAALELMVGETRAAPLTGEFAAALTAYTAQLGGYVPPEAGWPMSLLVCAFMAQRTAAKIWARRDAAEAAADAAAVSKAAGATLGVGALFLAGGLLVGCQALAEAWTTELPGPAAGHTEGPPAAAQPVDPMAADSKPDAGDHSADAGNMAPALESGPAEAGGKPEAAPGGAPALGTTEDPSGPADAAAGQPGASGALLGWTPPPPPPGNTVGGVVTQLGQLVAGLAGQPGLIMPLGALGATLTAMAASRRRGAPGRR